MELRYLLPCLQELTSGLYPEADKSTSHPWPVSCSFKIRCNTRIIYAILCNYNTEISLTLHRQRDNSR